MRTITDHKVNGLNEALNIAVLDEQGAGGANHKYSITLPDWKRAPDGSQAHHIWDIDFQNGPVGEVGFNGISNEALVAVVIDRMRGFQGLNFDVPHDPPKPPRAPFACRENALALTHLEQALMWLQKRTRDRMARGVEGQNKA